MTRRLLAIAGGGGTITQGPLGRIPGTYGQDDLLPGGAKIRGVNLVAAEAQWAQGAAGDGWSVLYEFWDADWMEAQLDDAVEYGCNVVRVMGSIRGIWLSNYTRAAYLARWSELIEMCRVRGLYLYPVGNPGGVEISDIPYATVEAEIVAWATHVAAYRTSIAIDVVQEDDAYGASADGQALLDALRDVVTLPLTYSIIGGTKSQLEHADSNAPIAALIGRVDFFDFHWYYNPAATVIEQYWWDNGAGRPTKKFLIGEYGGPFSDGAAAQTARYEAVAAAINYAGDSGRRPAGAFAWVARDFGTDTATEMWGLKTAAGGERTWITTPFKTIPKT